jgi:hypothetical protein
MVCVTGRRSRASWQGGRAPQWPLPTEKALVAHPMLPAVGPGLPWDEPIMECEDYAHWVRGDLSCNIWHRIPAGALSMHGARVGVVISPHPHNSHI